MSKAPTTRARGSRAKRHLRIFLNYRREDSSGHAGRLYDDLAEQFGEDQIFIDIDKIEPGLDFGESIERALDGCDVVLAVMGRHWLNASDPTGRRRLDNPDDYVRVELETALARGMRLIPVRVQGTEMPASGDLPESLRALARRQAVELSDTRWRYDVEALKAALERLAAANAEREREARRQSALEEAEKERAAQDQAERERAARERAAEEAAEQRPASAEADAERKRAEEAEGERLAATDAEAERIRTEQARREQEERAAQKEAERAQIAAEAARRQNENERLAREETERERLAAAVREREERERLAHEEAAERQRLLAIEEAEKQRLAAEAERAQAARAEAERVAANKVAREREKQAAQRARQQRKAEKETGAVRPTTPVPRPIETTIAPAPKETGRAAPAAPTGTRVGDGPRAEHRVPANRRPLVVGVAAVVVLGLAAILAFTLVGGDKEKVAASEPSAPASSSAPTIAGTTRPGNPLAAHQGAWKGSPDTFSYQWRRCRNGDQCAVISGATSATYRLRAGDVGSRIRVSVTATNAAGSRTTASKLSAVVTPALVTPKNSRRPTVSGRAREGSTLAATKGTWRGTKPISYTYAWLRCDAKGSECTRIGGERDRTYELRSQDVGRRIRLEVRASSAAGRTVVQSSATPVVDSKPEPAPTPTPTPADPSPPPIVPVDPPLDP